MLVGLRALLLVVGLVVLAPFVAWVFEPSTVLVHPDLDRTSVLDLVYVVLGSGGAGAPVTSPAILWFYGIFALTAIEALFLAFLLLIRGWGSPGVPFLASFLVAVPCYFAVNFLVIPHELPSWMGTWLMGAGWPVQMWIVPATLGLGLASLVHFSARFPSMLTAQDVAAFQRPDAPWKASRYRRLTDRLGSAYRHLLGRIRLPVDTPEMVAARARRTFQLWIEGPGVWIAFPVVALVVYMGSRGDGLGPTMAFVAFPVLGLSTLYFSYALFAVQRDVAKQPGQVRQVVWLASGLRAALFLWVVFGVAAFALTWRSDEAGWQLYMAAVFAFGPLLMATSVVTALGAAVLVGGAVDPNLAVRRTTVYGTLILCFAFLFAVAEEWVASILVERVGVSDRTASILLGATVAIGVTPLRSLVNHLVSRLLVEQEATGELSSADSI